ncbi:unnamed protein product, partial [marine sediment metagenome]
QLLLYCSIKQSKYLYSIRLGKLLSLSNEDSLP